jgi:hypothetical protein
MKLRFSIGNLLLLTALIAMGLGWYFDRQSLIAHNERLIKKVNKFQGDQLLYMKSILDFEQQFDHDTDRMLLRFMVGNILSMTKDQYPKVEVFDVTK